MNFHSVIGYYLMPSESPNVISWLPLAQGLGKFIIEESKEVVQISVPRWTAVKEENGICGHRINSVKLHRKVSNSIKRLVWGFNMHIQDRPEEFRWSKEEESLVPELQLRGLSEA